ncbi:hypothetical protein [Hydrogenophaga taeniospiralis]|uniref:hypothetical protein n=1 Tax=Hydrogenophaga taeniospiralis TaxID=65656 RepID=UPI001CF9BD4A|nr:hypothetical protein [Hydrogenophaga taeniospiralis]UCU94027.1 hypothetical protein KI616_25375 [Hydrogenophaga taeniospiralis]
MTLPATQPNYHDNTETGAPVINNTAGSVVAALTAVCCTGYNVRSVLQVSVTAGVATAMCLGHGYSATFGKLVKISGVSVPALNGNKQLSSVSTDAFTYPAPGVADGVYDTGSMEARRAPLGWEVAHVNGAGTVAIFRRPALEASGSMLRIVDTMVSPASTTYALASIVETATDADTVTGETPTATADRLWMRGVNTAAAKKWVIVGNSLRAWIMFQGSAAHANVVPFFYGDPSPLYVADVGRCFFVGYGTTSITSAGGFGNVIPSLFAPAAGLSQLVFQRDKSGVALGATATLCGAGRWGQNVGVAGISTPVPVIGDYYLKTATEVRARLPELYLPQADQPFSDGTYYAIGGRQLLALTINTNQTTLGQMMLDLSTPWE